MRILFRLIMKEQSIVTQDAFLIYQIGISNNNDKPEGMNKYIYPR